jgi:hypothetical protein
MSKYQGGTSTPSYTSLSVLLDRHEIRTNGIIPKRALEYKTLAWIHHYVPKDSEATGYIQVVYK